MNRFSLLLALTLLPVAAFAADQASSATAPQDSLAPPSCKKPLPPSAVRKADDDGDFQDRYQAWQDCVKEYVDGQNALAQKHVDAANAAVADANAFRDKVKQAMDSKAQ